VAIASAFHDLGIWTDGTFDYLPPSVELARAHLVRSGRSEWTSEISAMVLAHHKLSRYRGDSEGLAEPFRRADRVDVTRGLVRFGLSRPAGQVFSAWPTAVWHFDLPRCDSRKLAIEACDGTPSYVETPSRTFRAAAHGPRGSSPSAERIHPPKWVARATAGGVAEKTPFA
jgi:hypothetical protein